MAERNEHADLNALLAKVRELRQEVGALRRAHARAEERFDSVDQDLAALEDAIAVVCGGKPVSKTPDPPLNRKPAESSHLLELAAQSGVAKLEIKRLATGVALVRVDGGKAFRLSATLSSFLATLALDNAKADGELVGWKTMPELIEHLQKHLGRAFTPHAVHQLAWRLRSELASRGGVNPFLVQTHRQLGMRFALRKQTKPTPL
jgi:hypothetical protein